MIDHTLLNCFAMFILLFLCYAINTRTPFIYRFYSPETLRFFIAIEIPPAVRSALGKIQQELQESGADIRWVKPENIHLTLKFLGDIKQDRLTGIIEGIRDVCRECGRLRFKVRGLGVFPRRGSPRVLWADVHADGMLIRLQKSIEEALSREGFEVEKRGYSPHLTIGRFRSSRQKDRLLDLMAHFADRILCVIEVTSVSLMKSDLRPSGAEYTRVAEVPLGKS